MNRIITKKLMETTARTDKIGIFKESSSYPASSYSASMTWAVGRGASGGGGGVRLGGGGGIPLLLPLLSSGVGRHPPPKFPFCLWLWIW